VAGAMEVLVKRRSLIIKGYMKGYLYLPNDVVKMKSAKASDTTFKGWDF